MKEIMLNPCQWLDMICYDSVQTNTSNIIYTNFIRPVRPAVHTQIDQAHSLGLELLLYVWPIQAKIMKADLYALFTHSVSTRPELNLMLNITDACIMCSNYVNLFELFFLTFTKNKPSWQADFNMGNAWLQTEQHRL